MHKIELLAPAGNLEKLKIAVLYGADAVYVGGEEFSLREASENFSNSDLMEGVEYAHKNGVKVYIALNIIARNEDLDNIANYARIAYECGVDAAIVGDIGTFSVIKKAVPELSIHVSTQANTLNYATATIWYQMGAKRVVLARELNIEEIKQIRDKTPQGLEIEVFVHGAMCMSYSGRCLLSNYMIDRESNRGNCAQPCRWKYYLMEEKRPGQFMPVYENDNGSFIFNSKDLCLIPYLAELIEAGLTSLKIEGRVKSEFYVATVVKAYREAIDSYYKNPKTYELDADLYRDLEKVSHRNYSSGFFFGPPSSDGQIYTTSSYIREYDIVGIVLYYDEATGIATVKQRNRFFRGDEIEVIQPRVPGFFSFYAVYLKDEQGNDVENACHAEMILKMDLGQKVVPNSFLRKIRE